MIFNSEMNLLRRIKQRLLRLAGRRRDYDGARFYSQTGEDAILAHLLFGHDSGFYVDVGAFHPTKYIPIRTIFTKEAGRELISNRRLGRLTCSKNCGQEISISRFALDAHSAPGQCANRYDVWRF
jgi:hypothetical protein